MTIADNHASQSNNVSLGALLEAGTVPLDSPFYIERVVDQQAIAALRSGRAVVVVKGYRQSGKSSLLLRLYSLGVQEGWLSCYLNLQALDFESISNTDVFFRQLAWMIATELEVEVDPDDFWKSRMGPAQNLTHFVEQIVLPKSNSAVHFLFDEVDIVLQSEASTNVFFPMIRSWHNSGAFKRNWRKVCVTVSHATDPALWIPNVAQSPFNVGLSLTLPDFDLLQIADLNRRYGKPLRNDSEVRQLGQLVGGHPYLIRLSLWTLVERKWSIGELEASISAGRGLFAAHLDSYGVLVDQNPELREALRQVIREGACDELSFRKLWATGLVRGAERRSVAMRSRLYRTYFERRL